MANPEWTDPSDWNDRETCGGCGRERVIREVLDGDRLCQECCDRWAREEGRWEAYQRAEKAGRVSA